MGVCRGFDDDDGDGNDYDITAACPRPPHPVCTVCNTDGREQDLRAHLQACSCLHHLLLFTLIHTITQECQAYRAKWAQLYKGRCVAAAASALQAVVPTFSFDFCLSQGLGRRHTCEACFGGAFGHIACGEQGEVRREGAAAAAVFALMCARACNMPRMTSFKRQ